MPAMTIALYVVFTGWWFANYLIIKKPGRVGKHEPIDLIMPVTVCPPFI
jgi:hypothetical protein